MYTVLNNKRYLYNSEDHTIGIMCLVNGEWKTQAYATRIEGRIIIEMEESVTDYDEINTNVRSIFNGSIAMIE